MLDTNICSYIVKGHPSGPRHKLDEVGLQHVAISTIVRAELLAWLQGMEETSRIVLGVRDFLSAVSGIEFDAEAADRFAGIWHETRRRGKWLEDMGPLIAAHAISIAAILVTNTIRHFERLMPTLSIENWVVR
ncbi:MAG TPA: type II toxin-antitoxin system VapC family toxin [Thermomicrobiales bacterium]|nr:type II toxin-antitoxin system VapC family toxin [Thermomicrobiales bacterium]